MMNFFAHSSDAVIIVRCNSDSRIIHACSSAFHIMTGFGADELIGRELASLPAHGASPLWPIIDRLCSSITPESREAYAESYFTWPHSEPQFCELHAKCVSDPNNAVLMVTIRDRSEHKWIEDQVCERRIVASMLLTTADTIVGMRHYHTPIQYDRLELSRLKCDQFVVEQDRARVREQLLALRASRETGEFRFLLQLFQDRFHTHSIVKPFYNGDGSYRCCAIVVLEMEPADGTDMAQADMPTANSSVSAGDPADASFKLRLLMLEKRMSVTQLAENTKISLTTISNIRNGKIKKPHRLTAKLIADELGVSMNDLWGPYH